MADQEDAVLIADPLLARIQALPCHTIPDAALHAHRCKALAQWHDRGGDTEICDWLLELAAELEKAA